MTYNVFGGTLSLTQSTLRALQQKPYCQDFQDSEPEVHSVTMLSPINQDAIK